MSRYLPEGIIVDILSRLPAKSIQRFRCVCKSWVKLFSNPDFIKIHLKYAKEMNTTNLLIRGDDNCMYVSRDIDSSSSTSSVTCSKANEIDIDSLSSSTCLGSCNGIVCLHVGDDVICFWNPTTNEYKKVSKPESCYTSKIEGNQKKWSLVCGLGYDSNNKDYKFVMTSYTTDPGSRSVTTEVNLYSLHSNSWKIVEYNICFYLTTAQRAGVFLNGVLHWGGNHIAFAENGVVIFYYILSFDIRTETFNLRVQKPKVFDEFRFPRFKICVLGNDLCVFVNFFREGVCCCLDMWVMKDYGVRESWTQLSTVFPIKLLEVKDGLPVIPIHMLKNGEFLLEKGGDQKSLVLYDPEHDSARVLEVTGDPNWLRTVTYLESLVSPKFGNSAGA